ncbi:hypothetical protein SDC9_35813 [bioreactor metagenome]|uniref:Uncharacterized protein n=1 Tax=bioreactor metagenome TaxID=1076179 RepID=A0A644VEQ5_9ZZZZ
MHLQILQRAIRLHVGDDLVDRRLLGRTLRVDPGGVAVARILPDHGETALRVSDLTEHDRQVGHHCIDIARGQRGEHRAGIVEHREPGIGQILLNPVHHDRAGLRAEFRGLDAVFGHRRIRAGGDPEGAVGIGRREIDHLLARLGHRDQCQRDVEIPVLAGDDRVEGGILQHHLVEPEAVGDVHRHAELAPAGDAVFGIAVELAHRGQVDDDGELAGNRGGDRLRAALAVELAVAIALGRQSGSRDTQHCAKGEAEDLCSRLHVSLLLVLVLVGSVGDRRANADGLEVKLLQMAGDGARRAGPDRNARDPDHRGDEARGRGLERLGGSLCLRRREGTFVEREPMRRTQPQERLPGAAGQRDPRVRPRHHLPRSGDDIGRRRGPLGHHSVLAEPDVIAALAPRRRLREHLPQKHHRLDVAALPARVGREIHLDALTLRRGVVERLCLGEPDQRRGDVLGPQEIAICDAARHLQIDHAFAQAVARDQLVLDPRDLLPRGGHRNTELAERALQPCKVKIVVDHPAVEDRGHLVDGVTEQRAAIEDTDRRARLGNEASVAVDGSAHVMHQFDLG